MMLKYAVMVFFISLFQSSSCTTIKVWRNAGSSGGDEVENKGCEGRVCQKYGLHCATGDCCTCACPNQKPNYVVSKGLCKSNEELKQELNANCKYVFNQPNAPLAELPLTQGNGRKEFYYKEEILCSYSIHAFLWQHLDAFGRWQEGDQYVFSVQSRPIIIGNVKNDYKVEALEWSGALNSKYSGVIIKIPIKCENATIGCVLAKVEGSKTYDTTNVPTPATQVPPPTTTPVVTTTQTTEQTTGPMPTTAKNNSEVGSRVGNNDKNNSNNSGANAALAPALAVVGVLVLALGIAAFMFYRRRQNRNKDPEGSAFANPDYNEPVYAEVNKEFYDNPVYSDPAMDARNSRASHLGPLPCIPGTESPYQPLDSMTRKAKDSDEIDYENPIDGTPPGADYDNPPINSQNKGSSSDYDNPPVQGTQEKNSDYDNPPPVEGGDSEKNDYDVPKSDLTEEDNSENTSF